MKINSLLGLAIVALLVLTAHTYEHQEQTRQRIAHASMCENNNKPEHCEGVK